MDSAVAFHMASTWLGMVIIEFAWSMFQAVLEARRRWAPVCSSMSYRPWRRAFVSSQMAGTDSLASGPPSMSSAMNVASIVAWRRARATRNRVRTLVASSSRSEPTSRMRVEPTMLCIDVHTWRGSTSGVIDGPCAVIVASISGVIVASPRRPSISLATWRRLEESSASESCSLIHTESSS